MQHYSGPDITETYLLSFTPRAEAQQLFREMNHTREAITLSFTPRDEAQPCGRFNLSMNTILSFPPSRRDTGLSFSLPSPSFYLYCSTIGFFWGGKAKKVWFFSGAPAPRHSHALDALGSPYAPEKGPRRGSAGPWAPWRPFSDQKVGRRRSGARLFAFLSNGISVFCTPWPSFSFPPRPSLLPATGFLFSRKARLL